MLRLFLSLTELTFRVISPVAYFPALVFTGLLDSAGLKSSPAVAAVVLQLSAYVLPALVAWLVVHFMRAKQRLPTPLPGRHWLSAGLACTVAGYVLSFVLAGKDVPSVFLTRLWQWAPLAAIPLFVVGLVLAVLAMKPRPATSEAGKSAA